MNNSPMITNWILVWLTLGYLVATIVYVITTIRLLRATRDAIKVNESVANASQVMAEANAQMAQANTAMVEEMKASRSAQLQAMFDSTFFHMLGLIKSVVEGLRPIAIAPAGGHEVLETHYRVTFRNIYDEVSSKNRGFRDQDNARLAYDTFFRENQASCAHYFHTLYHVLRYVDEHEGVDRQLYAKIVRAQLTTIELVMLFYHTLTDHGRKMLKYVNDYGLLQDLPPDQLLKPEHWAYHSQEARQES